MYRALALALLLSPAHAAPEGSLPPIPAGDQPLTKAARDLNAQGFRAYKRADLPGAARHYRAAVQAAPGYHLARYNLACVQALQGESAAALAILKAFRVAADAGCAPCRSRVARARTDTDWKALWAAPAFRAIVDGLPPASAAEVATAVERAYLRGDLAAVRPFLPKGQVEFVRICTVCDDDMATRSQSVSPEAWLQLVEKERAAHKGGDEGPYFNGFEKMSCAGGCCRAERDGILHFNTYLDEVCSTVIEGRRVLTRVELGDG